MTGHRRQAVSFIIPVYNAQDTVGATLDSIVQLKIDVLLQLIVVDDGSTDRSADAVREWIVKHQNSYLTVELIQQANQGEAAAMNRGLQSAKHPVVAWVESDVTLDPDWLGHLLPELDDPMVAGAGGVLYPAPGEPPMARIFGYEITYKILKNYPAPRHITSANALYKKQVLDTVGPCRSELGESSFDSELNQRLRDRGYQLRCNPQARAWHRFKTTLRGCLTRAWWYGLRRPFVTTQVLYRFDRVIGLLVLAAGLLCPALIGLWFAPVPALWGLGGIVLLHSLYSVHLFRTFQDRILLVSAPLFLLRNAVFLPAYGLGWILKILDQSKEEPRS
ncbi:MAG: glycosyltransferase [bacterium]|jgi:glycosyltransferase involved in cell wall biosynthesis|nr:glycosyltransferase [bacterium]